MITNVVEWIKAEAGTGASIESISQIEKISWADLIVQKLLILIKIKHLN